MYLGIRRQGNKIFGQGAWRGRALAGVFVATGLFWAGSGAPPSLAEGSAVEFSISLDSPQASYQPRERVDYRMKLRCARTNGCGVVVVRFDPGSEIAFASHSVNRPAGTWQDWADVSYDDSGGHRFTIGTSSKGFSNGELVDLPVSGYVNKQPSSDEVSGVMTVETTDPIGGQETATAAVAVRLAKPVPAETSVKGVLWWDADRDGERDRKEPGVVSKVILYSAKGAKLAQTKSASDGRYSFAGLKVGANYSVWVQRPAGSIISRRSPETVRTAAGGWSMDFAAVAPESSGTPELSLGLAKHELRLRVSDAPQQVGANQRVAFKLVVRNNGLTAALKGWRVAVKPGERLRVMSMSGQGFTCRPTTCTATEQLKAGAAAATITVVMRPAGQTTPANVDVKSVVTPAVDDSMGTAARGVGLSWTRDVGREDSGGAYALVGSDLANAARTRGPAGNLADTGTGGVGSLALGLLMVTVGGGLLLARQDE